MSIFQSYFAPAIPAVPTRHVHVHSSGVEDRKPFNYKDVPENKSRHPNSNLARRIENIKRIKTVMRDGLDSVPTIAPAAKLTEIVVRQIMECLINLGEVHRVKGSRGRFFFYLTEEDDA